MADDQLDTTQLAAMRTRLAFDRTKRASERTLMAWIRTSLAMITFGFTIDTFFRTYSQMQQGSQSQPAEPTMLGLVLVGLGTLILFLGLLDHLLYLRRISRESPFLPKSKPLSLPSIVSLVVIAAGLVVFVYLLLQT